MASPRTISDEFNEKNYYHRPVRAADDEADIKKDSTRNVVLKNRTSVAAVVKDPRQRQAANNPNHKQSIDERFNAEYAKKGLQPLGIIGKKINDLDKLSDDDIESYYNQFEDDFLSGVKGKKRGKLRKIISAALKVRAYVRVTKINVTILRLGLMLWFYFQLPLAVASAYFFGVAAAFYGFSDNIIVRGITTVVDYITTPAQWVLGYIAEKIDVGDIEFFLQPLTPFLIVYTLLFAFTILQFLTIFLTYKIFLFNPVLGKKGAGLKTGTVLLYFIGNFIPLLNIFPWFLPWVIAVWINPK